MSHALRGIRAPRCLKKEHVSDVNSRAACDEKCQFDVVLSSAAPTNTLDTVAHGVMKTTVCLHVPRNGDV